MPETSKALYVVSSKPYIYYGIVWKDIISKITLLSENPTLQKVTNISEENS